jgi:hypothetical protein
VKELRDALAANNRAELEKQLEAVTEQGWRYTRKA